MEKMFPRIDLTTDSIRLKVNMPIHLKLKVRVLFVNYIKYRKGLLLRDAYTYCAMKAVETYENDSARFLQFLETPKEDATYETTLMCLPGDFSEKIESIQSSLTYTSKSKALVAMIAVGAKIYEAEGMPEEQ